MDKEILDFLDSTEEQSEKIMFNILNMMKNSKDRIEYVQGFIDEDGSEKEKLWGLFTIMEVALQKAERKQPTNRDKDE